MVAKNMQELQQRLREAGADPASLSRVFGEMGISPENPEALKQILKEAGVDLSGVEDKNDLANLIENLASGLGPATKRQVAGFFQHLAGEMSGSLPPDLLQFLARWQQGGR